MCIKSASLYGCYGNLACQVLKRGIQNEVEKLGINSEKKVFQKLKLSKNVITKKSDSKLFNKKELKKRFKLLAFDIENSQNRIIFFNPNWHEL